jgi:hypothetical protein
VMTKRSALNFALGNGVSDGETRQLHDHIGAGRRESEPADQTPTDVRRK